MVLKIKEKGTMEMSRTIAISNQKGGCGKTTTCINLAAGLTARGKKVLLIDGDPQATLTKAHQVRVNKTATAYDFILARTEARVKITEKLDLIPGSLKLNQLTSELGADPEGSVYLKNALDEIKSEYDYVIIDCPPQTSILANNCYAASDEIIIPVNPGTYSLEGIVILKNQLDKITKYFQQDLRVSGILLTNIDKNTNAAKDIISLAAEAANRLDTKCYETIIPHSTVVNDAQQHHQSLLQYKKSHKVTKAYEAFVEEVLQ